MDHNFMKEKSRELRQRMTDSEVKLWNALRHRQLGYRFNRQYNVDDKYIVDFYCAKKRLVVELDGGQHCENKADVIRDQYLKSKNFRVLRFWNHEVLSNLNGCLEKIVEVLQDV